MKERHDLRWRLTYWSLLALRHDALNTGVFRGARPSDRGDSHPGYRTSIGLMRQGQDRRKADARGAYKTKQTASEFGSSYLIMVLSEQSRIAVVMKSCKRKPKNEPQSRLKPSTKLTSLEDKQTVH